MRLEQALQGCSVGLLRKIASTRGVPLVVTTLRTELVQQIAADLISSLEQPELSSVLSDKELLAVSLVASAGGRQLAQLLTRRLAARLGSSPEAKFAEAILDGLVERGILFRVFDSSPGVRGTMYELPDELVDLATDAGGKGSSFLQGAATREPQEIRQIDPCSDLFILLSALRRELWNAASAKISGRRARTVSRLLSRLQSPVADIGRATGRKRWPFLLDLARRMGLVEGRVWPVPVEEEVLAALADRSALLRALWQANETVPAGSERHTVSGEQFESDVLALLSELPAGRWFPVEELITSVLRELGLPDDAEGGGPNAPWAAQAAALRSRLRRLMAGPWYWLGALRWGDDGDDWTLVSTTEQLGIAMGRQGNDARTTTSSACSMVGDLMLDAPLSAALDVLFRAETYLSLVGGVDPRRYQVTPASFARGVRLAGAGSDARRDLESLLQEPLPRTLGDAWSSWENGLGDVNVDAALLLSAPDGATLDRLLALEGIEQAVVGRLGDRQARLHPDKLSTLLTEFSANGIVVKLADAVRLEGDRAAEGAALGADAAELVWILLTVVAELDDGALGEIPGAAAAWLALETLLSQRRCAALDRRASTIAERLRQSVMKTRRRRPREMV